MNINETPGPLRREKVRRTTSVITATHCLVCFVLVAAEDFRPSTLSISLFLCWFRNRCKEPEWRQWPGHPLWSPGSCRRRPTEYWSLCWRARTSCRCTTTVSPAGSVRRRSPRGARVTPCRRNFVMLFVFSSVLTEPARRDKLCLAVSWLWLHRTNR